jgi:RHS repeat-associated protein
MPTVRYTVVDGEVLSELRGGVKRDYVPDPLGSTVALLDSTQTKTDTFQYWPYGESAGRTGTTATPFQYVGTMGYYTDSSGRNYVRARYLDKIKGRWITEDPIGLDEGINLFGYCDSQPMDFIDPSGLAKLLKCIDSFGLPQHWWIEFASGFNCNVPGTGSGGSAGKYPIWRGGTKVPDPIYKRIKECKYVVIEQVRENDPLFEVDLCKCVYKQRHRPWAFGFCIGWAYGVWNCGEEDNKDRYKQPNPPMPNPNPNPLPPGRQPIIIPGPPGRVPNPLPPRIPNPPQPHKRRGR